MAKMHVRPAAAPPTDAAPCGCCFGYAAGAGAQDEPHVGAGVISPTSAAPERADIGAVLQDEPHVGPAPVPEPHVGPAPVPEPHVGPAPRTGAAAAVRAGDRMTGAVLGVRPHGLARRGLVGLGMENARPRRRGAQDGAADYTGSVHW